MTFRVDTQNPETLSNIKKSHFFEIIFLITKFRIRYFNFIIDKTVNNRLS
jgi:hypothetical protein